MGVSIWKSLASAGRAKSAMERSVANIFADRLKDRKCTESPESVDDVKRRGRKVGLKQSWAISARVGESISPRGLHN